MASLAKLFYDAYMEEKTESNPAFATGIDSQFHGIAACAAGFMGALLGEFYGEHPCKNHVFFTTLFMKQLSLGTMGLFHGCYTREEICWAYNGLREIILKSPNLFPSGAAP
jgi:hypothetical protein